MPSTDQLLGAGDPASEVVLRPAAPEDVDAVVHLYLASREAAPMPPGADAGEVTLAAIDWFGQEHEAWVAEHPVGEVVGFVLLEGSWLHSLYVAPHAQRCGVGSALLDLARAIRPDGFGLWCFAENTPARAFYAAHGLIGLETTDGSENDDGAAEVRIAWPGLDPLAWLRQEIDEVDGAIARQVARRVALSAAVQPLKPLAGRAGRNPDREADIARRMAQAGPGVGEAAYARVVDLLVDLGLTHYERSAEDLP